MNGALEGQSMGKGMVLGSRIPKFIGTWALVRKWSLQKSRRYLRPVWLSLSQRFSFNGLAAFSSLFLVNEYVAELLEAHTASKSRTLGVYYIHITQKQPN